jgi:hypothetical protein
MKKRTIIASLILVLGLFLAVGLVLAAPLDLSEGFDDITTLPGAGWFSQNNSSPIGSTGWFQGNAAVFVAHSGATNSYLGANFNNTAGTGTISNWMLTPVLSLNDGDQVSFWTRTADGSIWPDRLELRLSTAGASTNVGTLATDVGDFTTLLLSVNPDLTQGGYPAVWTEYMVTISGVGTTPVDGRLAFRYYVTNAGPTGTNSNYIGIDTFSFTDVVVTAPDVSLNKTVGTDPAVCAATDTISVPSGYGGTDVYYCYEITNTGDVTLTFHTLTDSELGLLLGPDAVYDLGPGEVVNNLDLGLIVSATITQTTTNTGTWTITNDQGGQVIAEDSDTATVTVQPPTSVSLSSFTGEGGSSFWPLLVVLGLVAGLGLAIRRKVTA